MFIVCRHIYLHFQTDFHATHIYGMSAPNRDAYIFSNYPLDMQVMSGRPLLMKYQDFVTCNSNGLIQLIIRFSHKYIAI